VPVSVVAAIQQSMPVKLQAIGNVEAYSTVSVKARVDGQIVALNFKEGQEIRKGDILFRIDARPYDATLKQAEANALRDAAATRPGAVRRSVATRSFSRRTSSPRKAYAQNRDERGDRRRRPHARARRRSRTRA
jgi:multidrug efflux pump subunit AcrA (membrane-fusion protein)